MKAYGTSGALVTARGSVDVPTTPLARPAHWPPRIDRNRETRSPVAAALKARTAQDVAAERALSAERTEAATAERKARRRRGKEPDARTPRGTENVDALRAAVLEDVRRRVDDGQTDDVIAAALRIGTLHVRWLRDLAATEAGAEPVRTPPLLAEIARGGLVEDIAERVGCSPSTVVRARARIRRTAAEVAAPAIEAEAALILTGKGPRTPRVAELLDERFATADVLRRERAARSRPYDPTLARARAAARATGPTSC